MPLDNIRCQGDAHRGQGAGVTMSSNRPICELPHLILTATESACVTNVMMSGQEASADAVTRLHEAAFYPNFLDLQDYSVSFHIFPDIGARAACAGSIISCKNLGGSRDAFFRYTERIVRILFQ